MASKEWEFIGQGADHKVYRSPYNPNIFIKVPRALNALTLVLTGMNAENIEDELRSAENLVLGSRIKIPETRIVRRKHGYLMFQEGIIKDQSIEDIGTFIDSQKIQLLSDKYHEDSRNFICSDGFIYWIDPTRGKISRALNKWGIIKYERYVHLRAGLRRFWSDKFHFFS